MQRGRHWVLVVLLLGNVIVNESLPIFLDSAIGGGLPAVAISTTTIGATLYLSSHTPRLTHLFAVIFGYAHPFLCLY